MENDLFEKLYRAYYMRVYSYLVALAKDTVLAEELTQETFYKAYTAKADFRAESDEGTWLCSIAKNLYTDVLRRKKRQTELPEEIPTEDNPEEKISDKEDSLRIHRILHTLEEPYREVFELRVFGELSFAEIGTVFGKTEGWARVTYHRAKIGIQERMKQ